MIKNIKIVIFTILFTFLGVLGLPAFSNAQTATTSTTTVPNQGTTQYITPGVPSTGAGSNAAVNIAILLSSGIVAVSGIVYLRQSFAK